MKRNIIYRFSLSLLLAFIIIATPVNASGKNNNQSMADGRILFQENFEDTEFAARGWYDHLRGELSTTEHIENSTASLECKFLQGATGPVGGTPGRHLFEETGEVYLSYYVKYSANYIGSGKPYHPHEFLFVTNENQNYVGPAYTKLTTYVEHNGGVPLLGIQDSENIDESNIGVDLTNITEDRSVAGCNGSSDGYPDDCYLVGNLHRNGKQWKAGQKYFSDVQGKYYKNDWHFIEAYFALNSIADGKGIADGVIKYWFDGELIIDHDDLIIRTGRHPDMKFNQFLLLPYIGDGSPVEQTMWIDNLTVATSRISTNVDNKQTPITTANNLSIISTTPNPFSQFSTINYELTIPGHVVVKVYDVLGNEVAELVNEYQDAGAQSCFFSATGRSDGMYYYTIRIGNKIESGKMVLAK